MSASTFSWLAYDDAERDQFATLLRALEDPATLDSIGIGVVRDTIANLLFPGTSTIQTRARYFILVSRAAIEVERSSPSSTSSFDQLLRRFERRTLDALRVNGVAGTGIIGWNSGYATKRWPSAIYWNGLSEWGIRRRATNSLRSYSVAVATHARRRGQRLEDEPGETDPSSDWWDELPAWEAAETFPRRALDIEPTPAEAQYLLHRMAGTFAGGVARPPTLINQPSLLSLAARDRELSTLAKPWDMAGAVNDPYLSDVLANADLFALVVHGAQLLYNRLLIERARELGNDLDDGNLVDLETHWYDEMRRRHRQVDAWSGEFMAFASLIRTAGGRLSPKTVAFYKCWIDAAAEDPGRAYVNPSLREMVAARERDLKGRHARLAKTEPLTRWDGALFGSTRLDYRWGITRRHLRDCWNAIEGTHAES